MSNASDDPDVVRVVAEFTRAVQALLCAGQPGRIEVNVHPAMRRGRIGEVKTFMRAPDSSYNRD